MTINAAHSGKEIQVFYGVDKAGLFVTGAFFPFSAEPSVHKKAPVARGFQPRERLTAASGLTAGLKSAEVITFICIV
jgi:hypothetical protein